MHNLCIDIGNTRVKVLDYINGEAQTQETYLHQEIDWDAIAKAEHYDGIAVSNVSDLQGYDRLHHITDLYVELNEYTPLPFVNGYDTPETLGKDRLAAVLGARAMFPQEACCVIDIGTCVTLDFLDEQDIYQGGNISPGVNLRLLAMHHFTDGLPLLDLEDSESLLGKSTKEAMLNGAMNGLLYEIEGFLERLDAMYPAGFKTILTGGGASHLGKKLKREIFVNPFLIPYGLNALLEQL